MRVTIYDWASSVGEARLRPYVHNQVIEMAEEDIFVVARTFYNDGLNVQIRQLWEGKTKKSPGTKSVIIFVDTERFQQR